MVYIYQYAPRIWPPRAPLSSPGTLSCLSCLRPPYTFYIYLSIYLSRWERDIYAWYTYINKYLKYGRRAFLFHRLIFRVSFCVVALRIFSISIDIYLSIYLSLHVYIYRDRRFTIQRGHEHTRTGNWSESGFRSLRGAPLRISRYLGGQSTPQL